MCPVGCVSTSSGGGGGDGMESLVTQVNLGGDSAAGVFPASDGGNVISCHLLYLNPVKPPWSGHLVYLYQAFVEPVPAMPLDGLKGSVRHESHETLIDVLYAQTTTLHLGSSCCPDSHRSFRVVGLRVGCPGMHCQSTHASTLLPTAVAESVGRGVRGANTLDH